MLRQNADLPRPRPRATSRDLAQAMVVDPALIVWLDGQDNTAKAPEREPGPRADGAVHARHRPLHRDRRQGGGPGADRLEGRPARPARRRCVPKRHDDGSKTILGRDRRLRRRGAGRRCCSASRRRPEFVAGRLWFRLVSAARRRRPRRGRRCWPRTGPAATSAPLLRAMLRRPGVPRPGASWSSSRWSGWSARCGSSASDPRRLAGRGSGDRLLGRGLARHGPGAVPTAERRRLAGRGGLADHRGRGRPGCARPGCSPAKADLPTVAATSAKNRPEAVRRLLGVDAWTARTARRAQPGRRRPAGCVALAAVSPEYVVSAEEAAVDRTSTMTPPRPSRFTRHPPPLPGVTGVVGAGALAAGATRIDWPTCWPRPSDAARIPAPACWCWSPCTAATTGSTPSSPYADPAYHDARAGAGVPAGRGARARRRARAQPGADRPAPALGRPRRLAVVRGVGYPKPDRSHFRSMDIWQTARPTRPGTTGWLGRWLDATGGDPLLAVSSSPCCRRCWPGAKVAGASLPVGGLTVPKAALGRRCGLLGAGRAGRRALAGARGEVVRRPRAVQKMLGPAVDADRRRGRSRRATRTPRAPRPAAQSELGAPARPGRHAGRGRACRPGSSRCRWAASTPTPTSAAPSSGCSAELDTALTAFVDRMRPPTAAARWSSRSTPSSAAG